MPVLLFPLYSYSWKPFRQKSCSFIFKTLVTPVPCVCFSEDLGTVGLDIAQPASSVSLPSVAVDTACSVWEGHWFHLRPVIKRNMSGKHQLSPVISCTQRRLIIAKSEGSCFTSHQSEQVDCLWVRQWMESKTSGKQKLLSSTRCVQPVLVLLVFLIRPACCCHHGGLISVERTFTSSLFWTAYQSQVGVVGIPEPGLSFVLLCSIMSPLHSRIISDNF